MTLKELYRNKWVRFGFWTLLYVAWVIWVGNYWWLAGLLVIFDIFITRKVKWAFWKKSYKEGEKPNVLLEWLDAIIFAVIVVTFINIFFFQSFKIPSSSMESTLYTGDHLFVSKLAYGPRMPQTPLTVPFSHNVLPGGHESYSTMVQCKYKRLKGFGQVKRGDVVVFGFPNGDKVLTKAPAEDYYMACRLFGKDFVEKEYGPVKVRPMDKKDHYVKRCVAVPGDTLKIIDSKVYIGSEPLTEYPGQQTSYTVVTDGQKLSAKTARKLGLNTSELWYDALLPGYYEMSMTQSAAAEIKTMGHIVSVTENVDEYPADYPDSYLTIFPFEESYKWTRDNFGPIWVPEKGVTVSLTAENLPLYRRIITAYEHHTLAESDGCILIDGKKTESYTFEQDYYFMMGDNRHNSLDSRYWGFVPEDHIVGKPSIVWLSIVNDGKFPQNVRWGRFLKFGF
ncbi:MAG: signal peptidase I [Bacteroidales bacterium]|nr:signal peptidase I [Bacteroidales bacterium]